MAEKLKRGKSVLSGGECSVVHIREYLKHGELTSCCGEIQHFDRALETELPPAPRARHRGTQVCLPLELGLLTGTITRDYVPGGASE